jgi:uridine phosphorylase
MANRLLGVISALPEEFAHLSDQSGDAEKIGGLAFWRGRIAGREAVFVESGAGKVNAGVATSLLLDRFGCRALMICGVAGGLDPALGVGDVVVASATPSTISASTNRTASSPSSPAAGHRATATGCRDIPYPKMWWPACATR